LSSGPRGTNLFDGGAPFYNVYTCSDGRWMSVGCLEPKFFKEFITNFARALPSSFSPEWRPTPQTQSNREEWPKLGRFLTDGFLTNTRDYWAGVFHGTDSCALPVLSATEAAELASGPVPAPHPNLTRTCPESLRSPLPDSLQLSLSPGQHTDEILRELGITAVERRQLVSEGALDKHEFKDAKL